MLMKGKKGIIFGVANHRSIAWGIAQSLMDQGAKVAFSYMNERLKSNVEKLTADILDVKLYECDVANEATISSMVEKLKDDFDSIDFVVHSIAFANKDDLTGAYHETSRDGFHHACDISAYSLVSLTHALLPIMNEGTGIVTLTYLGSEKIVSNYNVMGVAKAALEASVRYLANDLGSKNIRVNAISAGPIKTLSAMGISGFRKSLKYHEQIAPLRRTTTINEVGDTAMFLCSQLSRGITSQIIYVDGGFNNIGVVIAD